MDLEKNQKIHLEANGSLVLKKYNFSKKWIFLHFFFLEKMCRKSFKKLVFEKNILQKSLFAEKKLKKIFRILNKKQKMPSEANVKEIYFFENFICLEKFIFFFEKYFEIILVFEIKTF